MSELSIAADNLIIFKTEIERIEKQTKELERLLNGIDKDEDYDKDGDYDNDKDKEHKAFFPLIEKEAPEGFYGMLESVTVHISKSEENNKFIIIPSEKEIEKKILEQCKRSWFVALDLSREYIKKPYQHHEVIIGFDKKDGFYEGSSLGIALTLSFLEQLLKFYNPTYIIKIKEQTAFTGGMTNTGKVLPTGEDIIKQKVNAVFFSEMHTFVIPKCEEAAAQAQLTELKKPYPNRKLKLIPIEDIHDVLNRRDVVDIRKQKLVVRTGKFVKKNWASAVVTVLLAVLFAFLFVMDWDDNPAIISGDGYNAFVKNKNGKVLWSVRFQMDRGIVNDKNARDNLIKIVDINGDGMNEVLYCVQLWEEGNNKFNKGSIICFNYKKEIIWKFTFKDTAYAKREVLPPPYLIEIIDTFSFGGQKQLFVFANNNYSFSSAIFKLNLNTGEKIDSIFWSSGSTVDAFLKDINGDGKSEIIQWGFDNGFEDVILCCFGIEYIEGYRPTTDEYQILGQKQGKLYGYIRFPKTDFDILTKRRFSLIGRGSLQEAKKGDGIVFTINFYQDIVGKTQHDAGIYYKINNNLKDIDIFIHDPFRITRDSLVAHGLLKPPYTDTKEYRDILKNKILYYKDGKWVKREELE